MQQKLVMVDRGSFTIPVGPEGAQRRETFERIRDSFTHDPDTALAYNTCANSRHPLMLVDFDVPAEDLKL